MYSLLKWLSFLGLPDDSDWRGNLIHTCNTHPFKITVYRFVSIKDFWWMGMMYDFFFSLWQFLHTLSVKIWIVIKSQDISLDLESVEVDWLFIDMRVVSFCLCVWREREREWELVWSVHSSHMTSAERISGLIVNHTHTDLLARSSEHASPFTLIQLLRFLLSFSSSTVFYLIYLLFYGESVHFLWP